MEVGDVNERWIGVPVYRGLPGIEVAVGIERVNAGDQNEFPVDRYGARSYP